MEASGLAVGHFFSGSSHGYRIRSPLPTARPVRSDTKPLLVLTVGATKEQTICAFRGRSVRTPRAQRDQYNHLLISAHLPPLGFTIVGGSGIYVLSGTTTGQSRKIVPVTEGEASGLQLS